MAKKKNIGLDLEETTAAPKMPATKTPAPKGTRVSPAAASRILEKADRLLKVR